MIVFFVKLERIDLGTTLTILIQNVIRSEYNCLSCMKRTRKYLIKNRIDGGKKFGLKTLG